MKFRAKISEILAINQLMRVVTTVAKMTKICVLRLTTDRVHFILLDRSAGSLWCEFPQANIFEQYNMEGLSIEHNEIYLELAVDSFVRALKSAQKAKSIKMKLTRKHGASLTVEIELASLSMRSRLLVHDIPVTVVARRLWTEFEEPNMPAFDVKVVLPALKSLKNLVDLMKHFSNHVLVSVTKSGVLSLRVESEEVSVKTCFDDLDVTFTMNSRDDDWEDESSPVIAKNQRNQHGDVVQVQTDIRKVAQFFAGQQLNPDSIICNIVRNRVIHFLVIHDNVSLQYFIPAVET